MDGCQRSNEPRPGASPALPATKLRHLPRIFQKSVGRQPTVVSSNKRLSPPFLSLSRARLPDKPLYPPHLVLSPGDPHGHKTNPSPTLPSNRPCRRALTWIQDATTASSPFTSPGGGCRWRAISRHRTATTTMQASTLIFRTSTFRLETFPVPPATTAEIVKISVPCMAFKMPCRVQPQSAAQPGRLRQPGSGNRLSGTRCFKTCN